MTKKLNDGAFDAKNPLHRDAANFIVSEINKLNLKYNKYDVISKITSKEYIYSVARRAAFRDGKQKEILDILRAGLHVETGFMLAITDFLFWTELLAERDPRFRGRH